MTWSHDRHRSSSLHSLGLGKRAGRKLRLLSEGILDANIDTSQPGMVRVALWREWPQMLVDLREIGPVWSIVRNGVSVLAVENELPSLVFSNDRQAARAQLDATTLTCDFRAWHRAAAFESGCCCGRLYGVEMFNAQGNAVYRICLAEGADLADFIEWARMHQATGLEDDEPAQAGDQQDLRPQLFARQPGVLEMPIDRLRTALIHAAQREIPFVATVTSDGTTQSTRMEIERATESHGWLTLAGPARSLYVNAEPTGALLAQAISCDGETTWQLSLIDCNNHRLLHLRGTADDRPAWNQLVREFVLCSTIS